MNICLLETFYTGSHKAWAEGIKEHLQANVHILNLSGKYWKWRMHGGAVSLAKKFNALDQEFDLILATDMIDLNIFLAQTRQKTHDIPVALYFHENQLSYPWSASDPDTQNGRNLHYGFINYSSALSADHIFFNSKYHRSSFLSEVDRFLHLYPDERNLDDLALLHEKSEVLQLGVNLQALDEFKAIKSSGPVQVLWNHRWEYDKNPKEFFDCLAQLKDEGLDFQLAVVGERFTQEPKEFRAAKKHFSNEIVHWGYVESAAEYAKILWASDVLPVSSIQDFFGQSIVEAAFCEVTPLLPRRLTYPELFSEDFLYDDLTLSLRKLLQSNSFKSARSEVSKYDWSKMSAVYLKRFENVVDGFR